LRGIYHAYIGRQGSSQIFLVAGSDFFLGKFELAGALGHTVLGNGLFWVEPRMKAIDVA